MTPEEITALAREYAEEECAKSTMIDTSNLYEDKLLEFYDVYGFLLRRYALVEKSKVKDAYKEAEDTIQNYRQLYGDKPPIGDEVIPRAKEKKRMLSYFFPNLGKEVEG